MKPVQTRCKDVAPLDFPGAKTLRRFLSGLQTDGSLVIFKGIVEPGVGPDRHIHHGQDEPFFFLEGSFDMEIDGGRCHMAPGDIGFVPRKPVHAFKNVGTIPGRRRYAYSPALKMDEVFCAFYEVQSSDVMTEAVMAGIAKEHGHTFEGPPL